LVDENQRDQLIAVEDEIKRNAADGDWDAAVDVSYFKLYLLKKQD